MDASTARCMQLPGWRLAGQREGSWAAGGAGRGLLRSAVVQPGGRISGAWGPLSAPSILCLSGLGDAPLQVMLSNGQRATVLKVTDEEVTIDLNHELAGEATAAAAAC